MLGSNSFASLGMDTNAEAGPSRTQVDGEEVDADWLQLIKANHDVYVRVSDKVGLEDLPQECSLMAVSNLYDLLIVGGNKDVRIHRLSDFHKLLEGASKDASPVSTPIRTINLDARPVWIRLAMRDERLVVSLSDGRGVLVYRLADVVAGNTAPCRTFSDAIPTPLLDVLPNPAPSSEPLSLQIALLSDTSLSIANIEDGQIASPIQGRLTAASWSAKGKQVVVGTLEGKLLQYAPDGTPKAEIPPPAELEEGFKPSFIRWLENDLFLVGYAGAEAQLDDPLDLYVISRNKAAFNYTKFFDPNDAMGVPSRSGLFRQYAALKSWGERTKQLGFIISGLASEVGILHGQPHDTSDPPKWETLILEETARGIMPAAKAGVMDDTSVIGLELDLTADKPIIRGIQGGIEQPDLPPPPRLLAYSHEGFIVCFNVLYPDAGAYPGMVKPVDFPTAASQTPAEADTADTAMVTGANTPAMEQEPTASTSAKPSGFAGFGSSTGFGATSSPNAFGASTTPQKTSTSAFGASAFGQSSTTPSSSPFAAPPKPGHTTPAFGTSAFGQSSSSVTAQPDSSQSTAFGQSAFGQPSKPSGTTAFGQSSFGQQAKSPFGAQSGTSAFGQSSFGAQTQPSTSSPSAFGSSSFGKPTQPSSTPAAFGQSTFGKSSQPTASTSSPSAFGQSAFGQPSKPSATSFPFGQSAFGSTSKPTSAFGSSGSPLGFGAFSSSSSKSTDQASQGGSGFGFGASAFGSTSKPLTPSPFGGGGSTSAFGTTSPFTSSSTATSSTQPSQPQPAFGGFSGQFTSQTGFAGFSQKKTSEGSAFGAFGSTKSDAKPEVKEERAPTLPPEPPASDEMGLGGFADALDTSSKSVVPGLEESPPPSPEFRPAKPSGLEDDESPPATPDKPPVPFASAKPTAPTSSATSAFIKPATAFGASSSGGFGAFGASTTPKSSPFGASQSGQATAPSTKPETPTSKVNAFSSTAASTTPTSTPSAFGSSSFGKPSTIGGSTAFGQTSKLGGGSAFGSTSTFGQPAKPVAFGSSSTPASGSAFGNVSGGGGFGAFAAKSTATASETAGTTGFGAFASKAPSGGSIFGSKPTSQNSGSAFGSAFSTPAVAKSSPATTTPPVKSEETTTPEPDDAASAEEATPEPSASSEHAATASRSPSPEGYAVPETTTEVPVKYNVEEATSTGSAEGSSPSVNDDQAESSTESGEAEQPGDDGGAPSSEPVSESDLVSGEEDTEDFEAGEESLVSQPSGTEGEDEETEGEGPGDYDFDGEYETEEDEDAEDEYEDEDGQAEQETDDLHGRSRTHSSSIEPELPSIEETSEEDEGEEDEESYTVVEPRKDGKAPKSPPPWFAKSGTVSSSADASSSLFGRLGPPPQPAFAPAQKLPSSFGLKHAARTSSPLGTTPPANASDDNVSAGHDAASGDYFRQPLQQPQPKPGSLIGLGKPPNAPSPVQTQSQTSKPFFSFNGASESQPPVPSFLAEAPKSVVIPDVFTLPVRQSPPVETASEFTGGPPQSMAAVLERMIAETTRDVANLKNTLRLTAEYRKQFDIPGFQQITEAGLSKHSAIPFSSLSDIDPINAHLESTLRDVVKNNEMAEKGLPNLQTKTLKVGAKAEMLGNLLQAHKDAQSEANSGVQGLSVRQRRVENDLQSSLESVESQIVQLESAIKRLQDENDSNESKTERGEKQHSKVESARREAKRVEETIREYTDTVDDLSERISAIKFSSPARSVPRGHSMTPGHFSRITRSPSAKPSGSPWPDTLSIPTQVQEQVRAASTARKALKARLGGVKSTRMTRADTFTVEEFESSGPIRMEDMPIPGHYSPEIRPNLEPRSPSPASPPAAAPKSSDLSTGADVVQQPRPPVSGSGFGGISFNFDPAASAAPAAPSGRSHNLRGGSSHRSHASAPKVNFSTGGEGRSEGASANSPSWSFAPPAPTTQKSGTPSGFFSLSGFGKE